MTGDKHELVGAYTIRQTGNVGQEIQDGKIICWTTNLWVAVVICRLLNQNEGLLRTRRCVMPEMPEEYQVSVPCPRCGFRFPDKISWSGHDGEPLRYDAWQCPVCRAEGDTADS